jgi:hypothetical protein
VNTQRLQLGVIAASALVIAACTGGDAGSASKTSDAAVDSAAGVISADGLLQHIKDLSADSMEGRGPGTPASISNL